MCLALVAIDAHPHYRLVVAANRDEFHARPAAPAAWWDEGVLAGRDLEAGGTWLGIDRRGRFALVTNVREPGRHDAAAPSRGALVPRFIADAASPEVALSTLIGEGPRYNGFNVFAGNAGEMHWGSNRAPATSRFAAGIHGLSNHLLDTPWPKVVRAKSALDAWCRSGAPDIEPLFALLHDPARAPDADLPATGVPLEWERLLSSPFIVSERYGTRCSTVVAIDRGGRAQFIERSFDARGEAIGERDYRFELTESPNPP